jgi:hypothetical protein
VSSGVRHSNVRVKKLAGFEIGSFFRVLPDIHLSPTIFLLWSAHPLRYVKDYTWGWSPRSRDEWSRYTIPTQLVMWIMQHACTAGGWVVSWMFKKDVYRISEMFLLLTVSTKIFAFLSLSPPQNISTRPLHKFLQKVSEIRESRFKRLLQQLLTANVRLAKAVWCATFLDRATVVYSDFQVLGVSSLVVTGRARICLAFRIPCPHWSFLISKD